MKATGCTCPLPRYAGPFEHQPDCPALTALPLSDKAEEQPGMNTERPARDGQGLPRSVHMMTRAELLAEVERLTEECDRLAEAARLIAEGRWATNGYAIGIDGARECAREALVGSHTNKTTA